MGLDFDDVDGFESWLNEKVALQGAKKDTEPPAFTAAEVNVEAKPLEAKLVRLKKTPAPKKTTAKKAIAKPPKRSGGKAPPRQFEVLHADEEFLQKDDDGWTPGCGRGRVVGRYRTLREANDAALDFFCDEVDEIFDGCSYDSDAMSDFGNRCAQSSHNLRR